MRDYALIFEKSRTGWSAYCPDLPGLASMGSTFEEVQSLIREGLEFHLESMLEDGDPIPDAITRVDVVQTDVVENFRAKLAKSA